MIRLYPRSIWHFIQKVLDPAHPCGDAECVANDLDDHGYPH